MLRKLIVVFVGLLLSLQAVMAERVLFVGDSITGHAENLSNGYAKQMRKALTNAGVTNIEIVCLGGSGQGVGSWLNVVKKSKESNSTLDIKGVDVKDELDKGADVLVIFLGMNDVLAPYTDFNSIDKWEANYQKLIDALKERTTFKELILAAPTMCTENPSSYRNRLGDQLALSVNKIAENNSAEVALTRDTFFNHWKWLRMNKSLGRMTMDYVHPNQVGHTAITLAMLNAIDQQKAAEKWFEEVGVSNIGEKGINEPGMLLYIENISDKQDVLKIKGEVANIVFEDIDVKLLDTMKVLKFEKEGDAFTLTVGGSIDKLKNIIKVTVTDGKKSVQQEIAVYAPWLVCSDISTKRWFNASDFKADDHKTSIDEAILSGKNPFTTKDSKGVDYKWAVYYPSADVTGGDNPDSVDFSNFSRSKAFDMGYMARNIYSKKSGEAKLDMSAKLFAGNVNLTVYWNGKVVYDSVITSKKGKADFVTVDVNKGMNTLIVKSNHVTWQWQNAISVVPVSELGIDDLKYSLPTVK